MRSKATNLGSVDIGSVVSLSCSGAGGGAETSGLRPVDLSPGTAYPLMYARDCALLWTGACGGWGKREKMLDLLAVGERSCGVFRAAARGNEGAGVSTRVTTDRIERDPKSKNTFECASEIIDRCGKGMSSIRCDAFFSEATQVDMEQTQKLHGG